MNVAFEGDDDGEEPAKSATVVEVWDCHWEAATAFLALDTQWKLLPVWGGGSEYLGLDYVAVDVVLRRRGAPAEAFDDIRVMEAEALSILNEPVE